MWRLLADENFNGDIVRGLLLKRPDLNLVRNQDVGLAGTDDVAVLAWAAGQNRILLTHDRATMPNYAFQRIVNGEEMPGMWVLNDRIAIGESIQEILLLLVCSEQAEWNGLVQYLPMSD